MSLVQDSLKGWVLSARWPATRRRRFRLGLLLFRGRAAPACSARGRRADGLRIHAVWKSVRPTVAVACSDQTADRGPEHYGCVPLQSDHSIRFVATLYNDDLLADFAGAVGQ